MTQIFKLRAQILSSQSGTKLPRRDQETLSTDTLLKSLKLDTEYLFLHDIKLHFLDEPTVCWNEYSVSYTHIHIIFHLYYTACYVFYFCCRSSSARVFDGCPWSTTTLTVSLQTLGACPVWNSWPWQTINCRTNPSLTLWHSVKNYAFSCWTITY